MGKEDKSILEKNRERVVESLLFLAKDIQDNAVKIVNDMWECCTSLNIELKGFKPDEYPHYKISYEYASQSFIEHYKKC